MNSNNDFDPSGKWKCSYPGIHHISSKLISNTGKPSIQNVFKISLKYSNFVSHPVNFEYVLLLWQLRLKFQTCSFSLKNHNYYHEICIIFNEKHFHIDRTHSHEHTEPAHSIYATKNGSRVQSLEIPEIVNIYISMRSINQMKLNRIEIKFV